MDSKELFEKACEYIPGGVNSPVRAFKSVDMNPIFIDYGKGSHIFDCEGNSYIDYICSWGPLILGHSFDILTKNIQKVFEKGTSFGLPTKKEIELAEIICSAYPMDMVRMVNSGTEATMSAIRVARGYTKKDKIIKFEGNYHGHSDCLLVETGSGALTFQNPTSAGVPLDMVKNTIVCKYNDIDSVKEAISKNKNEIACIILEPIACNMGLVCAKKEFLQQLRNICDKEKIVLIFDEVITGFRIAFGGASEYYEIVPDMACFGKIIGCGLPIGAYGGKKEIMEIVSPSGNVYQAGTLSGNPLAMEMGIRQISYLKNHPEVYKNIREYALNLKNAIEKIIIKYNLPCSVVCCESLLTIFFKKGEILSYDDVKDCNTKAFSKYYKSMLKQGFILPPSQFEGIFISNAHTRQDLEKTIIAMENALKDCFL